MVKLRANEATAYDSFITSKNSIDEISSSSLLDIDAIRPKLKTEPDTAFFWSGRTDGIGGAENVANIAKSRGGVTLESTIEKQKLLCRNGILIIQVQWKPGTWHLEHMPNRYQEK